MGEKVLPSTEARAPDFERVDTQGQYVRLSDYRGKNVVLVLNRGFT